MKISKRLQTVAELVPDGMTVADIGTDHGYVPIYLAHKGRSPHIIAMDINKGPLQKAINNIAENNVSHIVSARLSNGLEMMKEGEAQCIIIAGMGGPLINSIIKSGINIAHSAEKLILSPQSEVDKTRSFLIDEGFFIENETMVAEDGKFYFIMEVRNGKSPDYSESELEFGKYLIERRDMVMKAFLLREKELCDRIITALIMTGWTDSARYAEVTKRINMISEGLSAYDN